MQTQLSERKQDVALYVIGAMNEAKHIGWIGGGPDMTEKGWLAFEQLVAGGFVPTTQEIEECVRAFSNEKDDETVGMIVTLVGEARQRAGQWPEEINNNEPRATT